MLCFFSTHPFFYLTESKFYSFFPLWLEKTRKLSPRSSLRSERRSAVHQFDTCTPSYPFTRSCAYSRSRREGLEGFAVQVKPAFFLLTKANKMESAFVSGAAPIARSSFQSGRQCMRRTARAAPVSGRRSPTMVAGPPVQEVLNVAFDVMARTADIGPFTNVNVESAVLAAGIGGGLLIASFITFVLVRF